MYAGHFAAGLVLKAKEPHAPMWGILIGVGLLDLLFGPFVLVGLERASVTPGASPGFSLDHIDWSHSLVMSVVWSLLYAGFFIRWGARVAGIMGLAAFSHFLLDLPMHPVPACVYYLRKARTSTEFGGRAVAVAVVVLLLHVTNSPWLSAL
jgi:hypothetical protein